MKNSKLLTFLKTLNDSELKEWGKYIELNSNKKAKDAITFFNYLKKYHPEFPEKKIAKEVIARKIYPNETNGIKKIENLMFKFGIILEDFLVLDQLKKKEKEREFLLLQSLKERKLDKFFFKKTDELERKWDIEKHVGAEHTHYMYRLQRIRLSHPNYEGRISNNYDVKSLIRNIEQYYLAVKMHLNISDVATHSYVDTKEESVNYQLMPIEQIIAFANTNKGQHSIHVLLFLKIYQAFKGDLNSIGELQELRKLFFENADRFTPGEQSDVVTLYLNFLFFEKYKEGELQAINDLFLLNKFSTEKKFLIYKGHIAIDHFQNIVNIGCAAKELDWTERFIEEYAPYVETGNEDGIALSKMAFYLKKKDYDKVLNTLAQLKFKNAFNNAFGRAMQLIAYFETEGFEELFYNATKSFNLFLIRNKTLSDRHKKSFNNFIIFAKKIDDARNEYKSDIKALKQEILDCKLIVYQSWLLEKLEEAK